MKSVSTSIRLTNSLHVFKLSEQYAPTKSDWARMEKVYQQSPS